MTVRRRLHSLHGKSSTRAAIPRKILASLFDNTNNISLAHMRLARYFSGSIRTRTRLDRVLALLAMLLLTLQLLSSGQHKDDHVGYSDDCASCFFAHHLPSSLPDVNPSLVPVTAALSYRLLRFVIQQAPTRISFLIPCSQAPPRA